MRIAAASLFASFVFSACGSDDSSSTASADGGAASNASDASAATDAGGNASSDGSSSSSDAGGDGAGDSSTCTPPATPAKVVFLDKNGGTYAPAANGDSSANTTPLVNQQTAVTAWTVAPSAWTSLVDCVKTKLAPFNVTITDVDPGPAEHVEVVFSQANSDLFPGGAVAVSELKCTANHKGVAFVQQAHAEASPTNGCAAAVAVYALTLGLEYVTACPDAMSFDYTSCNTAGFSKTPLQCGTNTATNCVCGTGTTQTSFDRMLAVLGPRCL